MDSSNFNQLKAKKANSILKHRQLRKIANLLRFLEVCVLLVLISRLSFQLPVAVKNSSEYFRDFSVFMVSPRFVFLVGNAIIITLFAQSGQFSAHGSTKTNPEPDLYQEFIENSTKNQRIQAVKTKYPEKQSIETEDSTESQSTDGDHVKYPVKQSIRTDDSIKSRRIDKNLINVKYPEKRSMKPIIETGGHGIDGGQNKLAEKQSMKTEDTNISLEVKEYRRCKTEILSRVQSEKPRRVLQRCETENSRRSIEPATPERVARTSYPEDGMSNEEFRRTIEAFIARQQRLRREEECFTA